MDYTRFLPDSPEALTRWEFRVWVIVGVFGFLAIALGFVAREIARYRGSIVQARFDEAIKQRDDKANAANEAADRARRDAESAHEGLAKSNAEIARLTADSSAVSRKVEDESQKRANAERALRELRQRQAPRRLSPDQRASIVAALLKARGEWLHVVRLADAEAGRYADDLVAAFQEAGWNIRITSAGGIVPPPYGVIYTAGGTAPLSAEALLAGLKAAGIAVAISDRPMGPGPGLLVGLKPVPTE